MKKYQKKNIFKMKKEDHTMKFKNIPAKMREMPHWIVWRLEDNGGKKPTKIPIVPSVKAITVRASMILTLGQPFPMPSRR